VVVDQVVIVKPGVRGLPAPSKRWRGRSIAARIARKGIETSDRLGRHRWVIERTLAWLTGCRRLTLRYERHASHFLAFLTLAATITCYKKLTKCAT